MVLASGFLVLVNLRNRSQSSYHKMGNQSLVQENRELGRYPAATIITAKAEIKGKLTEDDRAPDTI